MHYPVFLQEIGRYFKLLAKRVAQQRGSILSEKLNQQLQLLLTKYQDFRSSTNIQTIAVTQSRSLATSIETLKLVYDEVTSIHKRLYDFNCINKDSYPGVQDEKDIEGRHTFLSTSSINKQTLQHCTKLSLSVVIAMFLWLNSNWPGGLQGVISSFVIAAPKLAIDSIKTAYFRFLGCCMGGAVGLVLLYFVIDNVWLLLLFLFLFASLFAYISFAYQDKSYLGIQANIAFAMTLIQADSFSLSILPALQRLSGIFLGIGATLFVSYFLWPNIENKSFQQSLAKVANLLLEYLQCLSSDTKNSYQVILSKKINQSILELEATTASLYAIDKSKLTTTTKFTLEQLQNFKKVLKILDSWQRGGDTEQAKKTAQQIVLDLDHLFNLTQLHLQAICLIQQNGTHLVNLQICQHWIKSALLQLRHSPNRLRLERIEVANLVKVINACEMICAITPVLSVS